MKIVFSMLCWSTFKPLHIVRWHHSYKRCWSADAGKSLTWMLVVSVDCLSGPLMRRTYGCLQMPFFFERGKERCIPAEDFRYLQRGAVACTWSCSKALFLCTRLPNSLTRTWPCNLRQWSHLGSDSRGPISMIVNQGRHRVLCVIAEDFTLSCRVSSDGLSLSRKVSRLRADLCTLTRYIRSSVLVSGGIHTFAHFHCIE